MPCSSNNKNTLLIIFSIFIIGCNKIIKNDYLITSQPQEIENTAIQTGSISKKFKLSKIENYELETKFLNIIDDSYEETYNKFGLNFNYSINPEGVIYSYSEVTVNCIIDSKNSQKQKFIDNCNYFFSLIETKLSKILGAKNESI